MMSLLEGGGDMKFLFFNKWRMYQDPWGPTIGNLWFSRLGIYETKHLGIYVAQHVGIYETQDLGIYEAQHLGIYETQDLWGIWYRRFYDTVYSHAISTNFCSHFYVPATKWSGHIVLPMSVIQK